MRLRLLLFLLLAPPTQAFHTPQYTSSKLENNLNIYRANNQSSRKFQNVPQIVRSSRRNTALSVLNSKSKTEKKASGSAEISDGNSSKNEANGMVRSSRLKRLKDRMWAREALDDLTAAEFAISLSDVEEQNKTKEKKKQKRAVDFGSLERKLRRRIEELCNSDGDVDDICELVTDGVGMGSVVFSPDQRAELLENLLNTREIVLRVLNDTNTSSSLDEDLSTTSLANGNNRNNTSTDDGISKKSRELEDLRLSMKKDAIRMESRVQDEAKVEEIIQAEEEAARSKNIIPSLYIREDGTVDWDGALQDREALRKFGTSVWARINGQDPDAVDEDNVEGTGNGHETKKVQAKIVETDEIRAQKDRLNELQTKLKLMETDHNKLLMSGIGATSTVAKFNLASIGSELRNKIRDSDAALEKMREKVSFQMLNYELERIFVFLEGEVANPTLKGYVPLQDRLNVAEFGLLESQVDSMNELFEAGEIVDGDVLAVIVDQVTDLKRKLGIDYYVTGLTYDSEAIQRWLQDAGVNIKKGAAFYGKGIQLFWSDIVFSLSLLGKAVQGYTLKAREVRTIRRTFKDIITFIPVIIILIIPLSPVGHVFVFGAIQKFFPDFFPSCFTERRQNLLQLYESTEYSELSIDEGFKEKIVRALEAFAYVIADFTRKLVKSISGSMNSSTDFDADK